MNIIIKEFVNAEIMTKLQEIVQLELEFDHPNIVKTYEVLETEEAYYILQELLEPLFVEQKYSDEMLMNELELVELFSILGDIILCKNESKEIAIRVKG